MGACSMCNKYLGGVARGAAIYIGCAAHWTAACLNAAAQQTAGGQGLAALLTVCVGPERPTAFRPALENPHLCRDLAAARESQLQAKLRQSAEAAAASAAEQQRMVEEGRKRQQEEAQLVSGQTDDLPSAADALALEGLRSCAEGDGVFPIYPSTGDCRSISQSIRLQAAAKAERAKQHKEELLAQMAEAEQRRRRQREEHLKEGLSNRCETDRWSDAWAGRRTTVRGCPMHTLSMPHMLLKNKFLFKN
jgi:hypothetical protein